MATMFDDQLKSRLLAFQRAHGLAEDGMVGTKTWTKLAQVAATADTGKTESAADSAPPGGAATDGDAAAAGHIAPIADQGMAITAANFPLLFQIAEKCVDEDGVKDFLRAEIDLDLDEILGNIEAVLGAGPVPGEDGEK